MIIGLCGLARSGKDSFFNFVKKFDFNEKPNMRLAFADELKKEIDNFLLSNFEISAFTEDIEEKKIIRPMLVAYGMQKRAISNGLYWINKIEQEIKLSQNKYNYFVTDVRFPNEVLKIKDMGGFCIHIEREGNIAPNSEEEKNDPIVKKESQYNFRWSDFNESRDPALSVENFLREKSILQ
tara:strand:- start:1438 stop:1980 length:543 start_codon:yes stop_codon:yes gene_type:complete